MAELATFNILTTDGIILPVEGAAGNPTFTMRMITDGSIKSFGLGANEVGGGMGGAFSQMFTGGAVGTSDIMEANSYYTDTPAVASVLGLHDHVIRASPRPLLKPEHYMEWWDSATLPGFAHVITCDGTSGDNFITVPCFDLMTVGQGISCAGDTPIPADTKIAGLRWTSNVGATPAIYTVLLSKALVANATDAVATLTGSNLRARILARKYVWHGSGTPVNV